MSSPRLIENLWMNVFDEWMIEWMNEWMNENECGKAWEVIGMKNYVRISHFAHFKRLRYPTDQPTDVHDLCKDALKIWSSQASSWNTESVEKAITDDDMKKWQKDCQSILLDMAKNMKQIESRVKN